MDTDQKVNLPHRFREGQFRRYEHIIAAAVAAYPRSIKCNPAKAGLSSVTFTCRLRDAMRSFKDHKWLSDIIDHDYFSSVYDDLVVAERDGLVIVGDKAMLRLDRINAISLDDVNQYTAEAEVAKPLELTSDLDIHCLELVGFLAGARALNRPLLLRIDAATAKWFEENFDVAVEQQKDGSYILT